MVMNGVLMQYFEWDLPDDGKLWQHLAEDAEHLAEIGISHIWMPPATKGQSSGDVGYGAYDLFDIGEFDQKGTVRTKYGTREEYQAAIDALQAHGIWALADAVLNHKGWADNEEVDSENGNFDYLMFADIDYSNPHVQEEVIKWGNWYLDNFNLNGFRMDALKHIEFSFIDKFITALRETHPDIYVIGEYWQSNQGVLFDYLEETDYQIDLFDVALHHRFKKAASSWDQFDMGSLLEGSLLQGRPNMAVTFVDNHDSQPGQALESWVDEWFKPIAYAIILLNKSGLPTIFYGDYYGIESIHFKGFRETLDTLLALRRENAYGDQHDYFDHKNCIGYTRTGDDEHPNGLAFIATNGNHAKKRMYVGELHAGEEWIDAMGEIQGSVRIEEDGTGVFKVHSGSMSVWINKEDAEHIEGEADNDEAFEDANYHEPEVTEEVAAEAAEVADTETSEVDAPEEVPADEAEVPAENV